MAKIVDITEKLSFERNPELIVNGTALEVNADAETVLKLMGIMGDGNPSMKDVMEIYELIFAEEAKNEIKKMKLLFEDFKILINEAVTLIIGDEEEEQGEDQTHTMI